MAALLVQINPLSIQAPKEQKKYKLQYTSNVFYPITAILL